MTREEEGAARSECQRSAGRKPLWWDDGTDEESWGGGVEGDGWRGKTLLCYCVAAPEHCPVPLQHSASSPFV